MECDGGLDRCGESWHLTPQAALPLNHLQFMNTLNSAFVLVQADGRHLFDRMQGRKTHSKGMWANEI